MGRGRVGIVVRVEEGGEGGGWGPGDALVGRCCQDEANEWQIWGQDCRDVRQEGVGRGVAWERDAYYPRRWAAGEGREEDVGDCHLCEYFRRDGRSARTGAGDDNVELDEDEDVVAKSIRCARVAMWPRKTWSSHECLDFGGRLGLLSGRRLRHLLG